MTLAAIGLGANLGDAAATLRDAIAELARLPGTELLRASRLYRTPAWGRTEQPDFINAVALVETALPARDLLDALLAIERAFGRIRLDGEQIEGLLDFHVPPSQPDTAPWPDFRPFGIMVYPVPRADIAQR